MALQNLIPGWRGPSDDAATLAARVTITEEKPAEAAAAPQLPAPASRGIVGRIADALTGREDAAAVVDKLNKRAASIAADIVRLKEALANAALREAQGDTGINTADIERRLAEARGARERVADALALALQKQEAAEAAERAKAEAAEAEQVLRWLDAAERAASRLDELVIELGVHHRELRNVLHAATQARLPDMPFALTHGDPIDAGIRGALRDVGVMNIAPQPLIRTGRAATVAGAVASRIEAIRNTLGRSQ